jgi:hypothetical protein
MTPSGRLYFARTLEGNEVDFVFEYSRQLLAIEVKLTDNLGYRDAAGPQLFLDLSSPVSLRLLQRIYRGISNR